jgi:hypothetical protein
MPAAGGPSPCGDRIGVSSVGEWAATMAWTACSRHCRTVSTPRAAHQMWGLRLQELL